ncbi:hypothetical protein BABINDRAFT_160972 [Babjeviella inositovora NRRL Y-12698]|uniref:Major facilitator superfamily (MFS) profile domain-containing protein n=1 Tax=Babjeviella inositovora NRRL Y-12698 TaxID=984486 RepID=A0A1E3QST9_9ASCO|nr:uncharacterized protein BABINDRAFT_160972 [Babjeviella inositovora NRRL Y-12698]ODQ80759.1 hypothetical protein BABINDRAFT_160972 [Babjeviella inositovora NRRL Y-12698]
METLPEIAKLHHRDDYVDIHLQVVSIDEVVYQNVEASNQNAFHGSAASGYQPSLERSLDGSSLRQILGNNEGVGFGSGNETESYPDGGREAWLVVLGSFVGVVFHFGLINSLGPIQTYISTHQLSDVAPSTIAWIFSIFLTTNFGFCLLGGTLFDYYGSRIPMSVGVVLTTGGLLGTANAQYVYQFILFFSLCTGLGLAFLQTPLFCLVAHWFSQKRALAAGLVTLGVSVGGVIIPLMLSSLYSSVGFTWAIRVLASLCFVTSGVSIWLTKERFRKTSNGVLATPEGQTQISKPLLYRFAGYINNVFDLKAFKNPRFTLCALGMAGAEVYLITAITYFSSYAMAQGVDEKAAYLMITVINASGVLGRSLPGILAYKFGAFNVIVGMLTAVTVCIFALWFPLGHNLSVLYTFAVLLGITSASVLSLAPVCLAQVTPIQSYGRCYAMVFFMVAMGNLVFIPLSGLLIGTGSKENYGHFVLFCGFLSALVTTWFCAARYYLVGGKISVRV